MSELAGDRPVLLDLFCGGGGCSMGYYRAGFDVVGVDIAAHPRYPFEFHQADAMTFPLDGFDAIHASPPCQAFSKMTACRPGLADEYPDLVDPIRQRLLAHGVPFVIENVPGAPIRPDLKLCGCQFGLRSPRGLGVRRERWFETHPVLFGVLPPHNHTEPALPVTGHSPGKEWRIRYDEFGGAPGIDERRVAMGVEWMDRNETSEAIPPAFTEWIGLMLLNELEVAA